MLSKNNWAEGHENQGVAAQPGLGPAAELRNSLCTRVQRALRSRVASLKKRNEKLKKHEKLRKILESLWTSGEPNEFASFAGEKCGKFCGERLNQLRSSPLRCYTLGADICA
jgi:hypothetical protein